MSRRRWVRSASVRGSLWVIGFSEFDQHPLSGGDSGLMGFYQIHKWWWKNNKNIAEIFYSHCVNKGPNRHASSLTQG